MSVPTQVVFHHIPSSEAMEQMIRQKAESLAKLNPQITNCRVTVDAEHHSKRKGNGYSVRIDVRVPDSEVAVSHLQNDDYNADDAYIVIRDAFERVTRQLRERKEKRIQAGRQKRKEG